MWFLEWPEGGTLSVSVDNPGTPQNPDFQVDQPVLPSEPGEEGFGGSFGYPFEAGDIIEVTDGTTTKTHVVAGVVVNSVDVTADTVRGTAGAGAALYVYCDDSDVGREVTADSAGDWAADFSAPPGDEYDIQPGSSGSAAWGDGDGDETNVHWDAASNPVAVNDSYSTDEDVQLAIGALAGVLGNDEYAVSSPAVQVISGVAHGSLNLDASTGAFNYTPSANWNGADSFTYRLGDGTGWSEGATVAIDVKPVNDAPVAQADGWPVAGDSVLTVPAPGVLANDTDVEGTALSVTDVSAASVGTVNVTSAGAVTYTPPAGFHGAATFTYRASDGALQSGPAMVTITVTPPPVAPPVVTPPVVVAKPKVTLGAPVAPKTMKKSKSYTVYGSLKPKHAKGTKVVRIYKYKKVGKKWVKKGYRHSQGLQLQGLHPLQGQDEADEQG